MPYSKISSSLLGVLLLLITLLPVTGYSVELKYLYDVHMPVESRDENALKEAFKKGFNTVLIRVTGKPKISLLPEINDMLKKPSRYVQQYRYYEKSDESSPTLNLWIHFDGESLERQLIKAGLPVWGKERPAVLIWFAVERQGKRSLVGEDAASETREVLAKAAKAVGIPVLFPLLDLEDRAQVNAADVFGGFEERVLQASRRYNPDAVLIAWASSGSDGFWKSQWRLNIGSESRLWRQAGTGFDIALDDGVGRLAEELSSHLAVSAQSGEKDSVLLSVSGANTVEDYARISSYLTGLDRVTSFRPYRIEPGLVSFSLRLRGNSQDLERLIQLGGILDKTAAPAAVAPSVISTAESSKRPALNLYYQLLP